MSTIDRKEAAFTPPQICVIESEHTISTDWKLHSELIEAFSHFEYNFRYAEQSNRVIPRFRIPTSFGPDLVRLAEGWGEADKNVYPIGVDSQGRTDYAISLYRNVREEHIATVFPHAYRNDEMVRVGSISQAEILSELLYEERQRDMERRRTLVVEDIYVLEPQRHGVV